MGRHGRVLRDGAVLAAAAVRGVGGDPVNGARQALRLLPPRPRRALARWLSSGRYGMGLQLVALTDAGRRGKAHEHLARRAADPALSVHRRRRLAATALAIGDVPAAEGIVATLPLDDPGRPRLTARIAASGGDLLAAVTAVSGPPPAGLHGVRQRRTLRGLTGDLAVLQPGSRPRPPTPVEPLTPRPGRILHMVTASLPYRSVGYTIRTHETVRQQRALGLDAEVVTQLGFPLQQGVLGAEPADVVDGVPYLRLVPRGLPARTKDAALRQHVERAAELVRVRRPALVHAASNHVNGQVALALGGQFGLPVVYEVRGFLEETWLSRTGDERAGVAHHRLSREAETWVMRHADAVVTLSAGMRDEIVDRGVHPERVVVVPNGVDERFLGPLPDPTTVRQRLGTTAEDVVVGLLSTLNGYEGVDVLVRAVRLLVDRGAPVHLLVVGDGEALPGLRALIDELGLDARATLPGRVPFAEVRAYHAALDVFVVPRRDVRVARLVTPLKPLEAMASRRPVVASDLPALAEVVGPDRGVLVPPDDPAALAAALEALVHSPAERARLGAAAGRWVAAHRTWAAVVPRYLELYRRLGGLPAGPPEVTPARTPERGR